MDINAYLNRIGLSQSPPPTLAGLQVLQRAHLLHIPFENLDIHSGEKIVLDLGLIFEKVVGRKRGGFCYELNGLFYALLTELGFEVKQVTARVFSPDKGYGPAFDHLALVVRIENEEYLSDVGFGKFAFGPLKLTLEMVQEDERGSFAFHRHEKDWLRVEQVKENQNLPQYIFQLQARDLAEFEAMCHFHQTSPESHFTQKRLISLPTVDGRITLSGDLFKVNTAGRETEETIEDPNSFQQLLVQYFGFPKAQP